MTDVITTIEADTEKVDALKTKIAQIVTTSNNRDAAFVIMVNKWHTLISDLHTNATENIKSGKVGKDFLDEVQSALDFIKGNVEHVKGLGIEDLTDHIKPATPNTDSPASLTPIVPVVTANQVEVLPDNTVIIKPPLVEQPVVESTDEVK